MWYNLELLQVRAPGANGLRLLTAKGGEQSMHWAKECLAAKNGLKWVHQTL